MTYDGLLKSNFAIHDRLYHRSMMISDSQPFKTGCTAVLFFLFIFFLIPSSANSQSVFQGRLAMYEMFDANVVELPDGSSSFGNNLYATIDGKYPLKKISSTSTLIGQFKSQNFIFYSNGSKSRSMNQLNLRYSVNVSRGFAIQPLLKSEIKHYKDDPRNYRMIGTGFTTLLTTKRSWVISTETTRTKVYFPSFRVFNNLSDIISLMIRVPVLKNLFVQATAFAGNHRYSKFSIDRRYHNTAIQQRDNTFGTGIGMELMFKNWLANVYYNYHSIYSNSYGSSFSYHKIEAMMLKKIGKGLFVKLYGSTQKRYYHDRVASTDISSTQAGIDFQSAIVEIGKKIGDDYEVKARFHWFRNQTLFTNTYFNRTVLSVGIEKEI